MKPPRSIKIGAHTYTVQVIEKHLTDEPASLLKDKLTILLADGGHPSNDREHVLHETMHAALDAAGFTQDHPEAKPEIESELEERIALRLTPVLLSVIRNNPQLVKFLTEPD